MDGLIPVLAGAVSTVIFAGGTLPMLVKAARTKDLSSYSLGNIVLSNLGNVIQSIYVFDLPAGPMWVLHTFYLLSTALMLFWYLRYTPSPVLGRRSGAGGGRCQRSGLGGIAVPRCSGARVELILSVPEVRMKSQQVP
jgi:hypothetical protein